MIACVMVGALLVCADTCTAARADREQAYSKMQEYAARPHKLTPRYELGGQLLLRTYRAAVQQERKACNG